MPVSDDPFMEASHFQMDIWSKNVCSKNLLHSLCLIVLVGSRCYLFSLAIYKEKVLVYCALCRCQNVRTLKLVLAWWCQLQLHQVIIYICRDSRASREHDTLLRFCGEKSDDAAWKSLYLIDASVGLLCASQQSA